MGASGGSLGLLSRWGRSPPRTGREALPQSHAMNAQGSGPEIEDEQDMYEEELDVADDDDDEEDDDEEEEEDDDDDEGYSDDDDFELYSTDDDD